MENYKKTKQQLKEQFGTLNGLTSKEAEEKLNSFGENILEQTEKKTHFQIFSTSLRFTCYYSDYFGAYFISIR